MTDTLPTRAEPVTEPGRVFVAAAETAAARIAPRAADADTKGRMSEESFADLADLGVTSAFVPVELGGLGLSSIHDWALGIAEIARADASVAIAVNMHLGATRGLVQSRQRETADPSVENVLRSVAEGETLICAAATEPGTDNLHPLTEAVATGGDSHVINGAKTFVTMSPISTHLAMIIRVRDDGDQAASILLPIDTPGVEPQDDWNALGMRASGSQSIRFNDVVVPSSTISTIGPWGRWNPQWLMNRALGNISLLGASLGIAEAAFEAAVAAAARHPRTGVPPRERPGVQHLAAELAIGLTTIRLVLAGTTRQVDDFIAAQEGSVPTLAEAHGIMQRYQIAKSVVNATAIDVVNRAMDVTGGSSYADGSPLSRLYRDVRAAPFMQPGAPAEARHYIGRVTLGLLPED